MSIPFGFGGARLSKDAHGHYPAQVDGYPVIYYTQDGLTICADCASKGDTSDPESGADFFYEGETIYCDDCSAVIESAYGDPDAETEA